MLELVSQPDESYFVRVASLCLVLKHTQHFSSIRETIVGILVCC